MDLFLFNKVYILLCSTAGHAQALKYKDSKHFLLISLFFLFKKEKKFQIFSLEMLILESIVS